METIQPRHKGAVVGPHVVLLSRRVQENKSEPATDSGLSDQSLPAQAHDGSIQISVPPEGTDAADIALSGPPAIQR